MKFKSHPRLLLLVAVAVATTAALTIADDVAAMLAIKASLSTPPPGWSDPDPCKWAHIDCSNDHRVTRIQIGHQNLRGSLPPTSFQTLTDLELLDLQSNNFSGPFPTLNGMSKLQVVLISNNQFDYIPVGCRIPGFFWSGCVSPVGHFAFSLQ
ncbi:hypothetical protein QQ045_014655 [Rhodiola kirilowii]